MITINEYLVKKIHPHQAKVSEFNYADYNDSKLSDIEIPNVVYDKESDVHSIPEDKPTKTVMLPENYDFVVYVDKYHDKSYHIAAFGDMMMSLAAWATMIDYEDFGPEDIVYASNSLQDCVYYVIDAYASKKTKTDVLQALNELANANGDDDKLDSLQQKIYKTLKQDNSLDKKVFDNKWWMSEVITGREDEDNQFLNVNRNEDDWVTAMKEIIEDYI